MRLLVPALAAVLGLATLDGWPLAAQTQTFRTLKAEPEAWEPGTWQKYKDAFVSPAGRVIDTANDNISHSEGQGYGMLLAVIADDRSTFDRIWAWTKRELYKRPDGLASWKWVESASPNITDPNNASDGDLLIAWALAEAADRWSHVPYREEATRIAIAIDRVNGARSAFGRVFLPGAVGFTDKDRTDGPVVNLSYWIFPAIDKLRPLAPNVDWEGYRASGYTLAKAAQFGQAKLPTDWISIEKGKARPAEGFPQRFSYNAIRIPLYLAWAQSLNKDALRPYVEFYEAFNQNMSEYDVTTSLPAGKMGAKGYVAALALAKCAFDESPLPVGLRSVSLDQYYPTTLQMLSLAAARLRFSKCWLEPR